MESEAECCSIQLIDGEGTFNGEGLDNFIQQSGLGECGLSYAVVAIMGPQSSGKSTLINYLFHTNFKEMDTNKQRSKTTHGIWIAICAGIEPRTIVMDLEGTDGKERGEDDAAFEKQSALFALAVSDIVLINMWCHDIGRVQASNYPLLRTVFQVMLQICPSSFKKTLMFVIRDKTKTSAEYLEDGLKADIEKIWDSVPKPQAHKDKSVSDLFNFEVVVLCNYEEKEELFKEQVASLRQRFFYSITPGGLAGDRLTVVHASDFSLSTQDIWKVIKENKDLDLPTHRVMVATVRCNAIAKEKLSSFDADQDWLDLQEAVRTHLVENLGEKLYSMIYKCLSCFDSETSYYEASVTSGKRKQLEKELFQLVQPAYQFTLEHIQYMLLEKFKDKFRISLNGGEGFAMVARDCTNKFMKQFDERFQHITAGAVILQANKDLHRIRDNFSRDLDLHITLVKTAELSKLTTIHESNLKLALQGRVKVILNKGSDDTWAKLRELLKQETETAISEFSSALLPFEIDEQKKEDLVSKLKNHARGLVEGTVRAAARYPFHHMKERFVSILNDNDDDSMPRVWAGDENISVIARTARSASLKMLSVLAAIRLDEDTTDTIWDTLVHTLLKPTLNTTTSRDPLSSPTWEEVPATQTLIAPLDCKPLWRQFYKETQRLIDQATKELKEAKKRHQQNLLFLMSLAMNAAFIVARIAIRLL